MIWYFIRASIVVTLCGLAAGHCCADEIGPKKPPVIHLPTIPVIVEPDRLDDSPVPPPPVNPITTVATLAEDTWYVIESDVQLIVLHSPAGLVGISEEVGPVKVRGKFADGTGKIETRVFRSQCLYFVNALKAGKTELIVVPVGVTAEADIIRQPLTVMGLSPIPPPEPKPDPTPTADKLTIEIVEDVLNRKPDTAIVLSALVGWNQYLDAGNDFRIYDIKTGETKGKAAIKELADQSIPLPGLIIRDKVTGKALRAMPLPLTFDIFKRLVSEQGGGLQ